jgi:hypothetical protein
MSRNAIKAVAVPVLWVALSGCGGSQDDDDDLAEGDLVCMKDDATPISGQQLYTVARVRSGEVLLTTRIGVLGWDLSVGWFDTDQVVEIDLDDELTSEELADAIASNCPLNNA